MALLGGGFINTLGRGDDATLGIANFDGSALLTNIQGTIGNALGLSEFRLFPTLIGNEKQKTLTLGFAAEVGIDLLKIKDGLPMISATILRVLTVPNQNTQVRLCYRLNELLQVSAGAVLGTVMTAIQLYILGFPAGSNQREMTG